MSKHSKSKHFYVNLRNFHRVCRLFSPCRDFTNPVNRDSFLFTLELSILLLICVSIVVITFIVGVWAAFGCLDEVVKRLHRIFNTMDLHWKASLILLVPLFYRPARMVALHVEKWLNLSQESKEKGKPEPESPPVLNPTAHAQQ